MGEHDLAALATLAARRRARAAARARGRPGPARRSPALVAGRRRDGPRRVAREPPRPLPRPPWSCCRSPGGAATLRLGAALVTLARRRRRDRRDARAARSGELGFLQEWFGPPPERPGAVRGELEPAADLRLHRRPGLPRPAACSARAGTGELPPEEFARVPPGRARALPRPAARTTSRRTDGRFIPQQTYDQVLFQLGLVGAALFLRCSRCSRCGRAPLAARRAAGRARLCPGRVARRARRGARGRSALRRLAPDRDLLAHARRRRAAPTSEPA